MAEFFLVYSDRGAGRDRIDGPTSRIQIQSIGFATPTMVDMGSIDAKTVVSVGGRTHKARSAGVPPPTDDYPAPMRVS